ncbi:MAG: hypothetical protein ACTHNZ_01630 [Trinickia sp.]
MSSISTAAKLGPIIAIDVERAMVLLMLREFVMTACEFRGCR